VPKPAIGTLHRLAPAHRAATPEAVADSMVALHATDPASVHLAVVARTAGAGATVAEVDRALHDDRSVVRIMGMRRTMWAVPAELVPVVAAACGRAVAAAERRRLVQAVEAQGLARDGGRFVARLEREALEALAELGPALTADLTARRPGLARTVRLGGASKWAVDASLASRVVVLFTCEGKVVRARAHGGWTSTRNRYAVAPPAEPLETDEAQAQLAGRWLAAFGPLSDDPVADLKWWAGWTVAATRRALAAAGAGPTGRAPSAPSGPWAALVPSLDPSTMGWRHRSWYLGDLGPQLFDRNGNAGPAIWCEGRLVGGWAHRPTGEVVTRLLVDVGREGRAEVDAEAARLQAWLDRSGARVRPRFPTPLQKELAA
jgi:hypothetical protein